MNPSLLIAKGFHSLCHWAFYPVKRAREWCHFQSWYWRDRKALIQARQNFEWEYANRHEDPLVSIVIGTWNRGELLMRRALASSLAQTYQNIEVVIVGDCCTDDTEARLLGLNEPRVRFFNRPQRGPYPKNPLARYRVAGCFPTNVGNALARGKWIAPHNDDDLFTEDHVEVLLRFAQENDLEFAYGKRNLEIEPGRWVERGEAPLASKIAPWPATMQRTYVSRVFHSDVNAWKVEWPGDKHMIWRMCRAGVHWGFLNRVVAIAPKRPGQVLHGSAAEDRPDNRPAG